jgi:signal transduction histidine kinase
MLSNAQLISDRMTTVPDPTVQRFAPKLIASLDRAIRLCTETLKFGKTSELPPERTRFPVVPLLEECAGSLGVIGHERIGWRLIADHDLQIDADHEQLFRVLTNLLRNAAQSLEAGPGNGTKPEITVEVRRAGGVVIIDVADNGPGVPMNVRKHLFEPFSGSTRDGGTGLGLAIAAEIARAHGGQMTLAASTKGARFRLEIPDVGSEAARARSVKSVRASGNGSAKALG